MCYTSKDISFVLECIFRGGGLSAVLDKNSLFRNKVGTVLSDNLTGP